MGVSTNSHSFYSFILFGTHKHNDTLMSNQILKYLFKKVEQSEQDYFGNHRVEEGIDQPLGM